MSVLRRDVARMAGARTTDVLVVRSPYRICPLGAHVDHQLGRVTGMAIEEALLLGFVPSGGTRMRVRSRNFEGEINRDLDDLPTRPPGDWGDYIRGAAIALKGRYGLERGLVGIVDGYENVDGLSSSAAVGVACLLALECANGLDIAAEENIELDRIVENGYIGLSNGILDQSMILLSRAGRLTSLDCLNGESDLHACGSPAEVHVVILHSGLRQQLSDTDYNRRVAECEQAARTLLAAAGMSTAAAAKLRHVPREVYEAHCGALPEAPARRAKHFFGEQRRVRDGIRLWRAGDMAGFGRLVTESGRSSIENYECGNAYLRTAYRVLCETPGVLGARFSGAGFRGCCIGLAGGPVDDAVRSDILDRYIAGHGDMAGRAEVRVCGTADGAAIV